MTPTIEQTAALAWDLMKSDDDPLFSGCHREHQEKLTYHARDVHRTGIVGNDFERKVAEVLASPEAAIEAIKAKLAPPVEITPETTVVNVSPDIQPPEPAASPVKTKRGK